MSSTRYIISEAILANADERAVLRSEKPPRVPTGLNSPLRQAQAGKTEELSVAKSWLEFAKMQALGNDFVVVSESDLERAGAGGLYSQSADDRLAEIARALCNRHFGIGADGLIVVRDPDRQDCQLGWIYVNSDGSPSAMCGNGLRCVALWAVERGIVNKESFKIATEIGPVAIAFQDRDQITVDLGEPVLDSVSIPVAGPPRKRVLRESVVVEGMTLAITCVSMGNPHCVVFNAHVDPEEYLHLAPLIQSLDIFPEGINVEFALTDSADHAKVFVWERGCGPTLACASGAAAVLVAGVLEGALARRARIELPGGMLNLDWSEADQHVRLTGPAREIYRGTVDLAYVLSEAKER